MNRLTDVDREATNDDHYHYYLNSELWYTTYDNGALNDVTYDLDNSGNRNGITDGGVWKPYAINVVNQYTSADRGAVTIGSNNEVLGYDGVTYTYVNDGQLASAMYGTTGVAYSYDALGRIAKKVINGTTTRYFIYDGERALFEYGPTGSAVARHVYGKGIDEILERTDPTVNGGQPFYFHQDHEGSVTQLTNGAGQLIERYRYDAFGAPLYFNGAGTQIWSSAYGNPFLYTGRVYHSNGYYEYRARAYQPYLGRFTSEDPKLFDAGDYNLFRYCHNDPLDLTDPMGLEEVDVELRAFIQQANVGPFRGDNRTFSAKANESSRVAVKVKVETDPARNNGKIMIGKPEIKISPTHNNLTGGERKATGPLLPQVAATRDQNGNTVVSVWQDVRNPYQHVGEGIRSSLSISINQSASEASVRGKLSGAPAFEANFTTQDGTTTNLPLQGAPQGGLSFVNALLRQTNEINTGVKMAHPIGDAEPINPK